ncbi:hypothetical protein RA27_20790 [Ruegeria sp. ANG-R]|nr:hypothetical protein RA27_20790 [Ruegeria sp. ANG-R]
MRDNRDFGKCQGFGVIKVATDQNRGIIAAHCAFRLDLVRQWSRPLPGMIRLKYARCVTVKLVNFITAEGKSLSIGVFDPEVGVGGRGRALLPRASQFAFGQFHLLAQCKFALKPMMVRRIYATKSGVRIAITPTKMINPKNRNEQSRINNPHKEKASTIPSILRSVLAEEGATRNASRLRLMHTPASRRQHGSGQPVKHAQTRHQSSHTSMSNASAWIRGTISPSAEWTARWRATRDCPSNAAARMRILK